MANEAHSIMNSVHCCICFTHRLFKLSSDKNKLICINHFLLEADIKTSYSSIFTSLQFVSKYLKIM